MPSYYDRLSAERLRRCYELAPMEVRAYLEAEIQHILASVTPGSLVLELGCGYGRVMSRLGHLDCRLVGIDLSLESLLMARSEIHGRFQSTLVQMDVGAPALRQGIFDLVLCPQNGISAFHRDQRALIESSVRLLRDGGRALFFSYADSFWPHRLSWFRIQAAHGLVGEIDENATGGGTIICKDGFTATTVSPERFLELTRDLGSAVSVALLDESSVVCQVTA